MRKQKNKIKAGRMLCSRLAGYNIALSRGRGRDVKVDPEMVTENVLRFEAAILRIKLGTFDKNDLADMGAIIIATSTVLKDLLDPKRYTFSDESRKNIAEMFERCKATVEALESFGRRWHEIGKFVATGDELRVIGVFSQIYKDVLSRCNRFHFETAMNDSVLVMKKLIEVEHGIK